MKPLRIESIDLLKGLVMVLMALDHTRDYFFQSDAFFEVSNPAVASFPVYITRIITHVCAPTFSFLAGVSAFFSGKRRSRGNLALFLVKRGLWLVFMEMTIISFAWYFNVEFTNLDLGVIWVLGMSMIFLAGFVYLPPSATLIISLIMIAGHNLLDSIHFKNVWWGILHEVYVTKILGGYVTFTVVYPLIPWIGVMALGYYFGRFYQAPFTFEDRRRLFNKIGFSTIALFLVIRWLNVYGDPVPWTHLPTSGRTLMSFFNVSKYPPSLSYLLVTLTFTFLFLANAEKWRGKVTDFFCVFGRVPFFYYIVHLYTIRIAGMIGAELMGFGWQTAIQKTFEIDLHGFGFSLPVVYLIWISIIATLYPVCKWFDRYKQNHGQWWLSYL